LGDEGLLEYVGLDTAHMIEKVLDSDVEIEEEKHSNVVHVKFNSKKGALYYEASIDDTGKPHVKKLAHQSSSHKVVDIHEKMAFILWEPSTHVSAHEAKSHHTKKMTTLLYHWAEIDVLWHGTVDIVGAGEGEEGANKETLVMKLNPDIEYAKTAVNRSDSSRRVCE